jgi:sulfofructose kinase
MTVLPRDGRADGHVSYVVCVGLATRDTILAVPRHPAADELVLATDAAIAGGGPAATAAVALARLGVSSYFVGSVGDDETGAFIREGLASEGVDVSELAVVSGRRSPQSAIYVGPGTRAIAAFRGDTGAPRLSARADELCRGAAWVHVDQTGYGCVPRDVRLSIDAGIPIDRLDLAGVALYAPTETRLARDFGTAEAALAAGAELVVVTRGEGGCTAWTSSGEVVEVPATPLEDPVSTLGAGDVFHGALLAALVRERPLAEALVFANRAAALSCGALDGRSAIPTLEEIELHAARTGPF